MSRIIIICLVAFLLLDFHEPIQQNTASPSQKETGTVLTTEKSAPPTLRKLFTPTDMRDFKFPFIHIEDANALGHNDILLNGRNNRNFKLGSLEFSSLDLQKTQQILQSWQFTTPLEIENSLEAHQLKGFKGTGDVKFTAYFTPEFEVRAKKTDKFQYPVTVAYKKRSKDKSDKLVDGLSITTLYTSKSNAVSSLRMQGSGYLVFSKTRKVLVKYVSNPDRYISKRHVFASGKNQGNGKSSYNASRNFFLASASDQPNGACKTELTPFRSIAVDPDYIPLGSILLAKVPYRTPDGDLLYETQLLYAQDTGGGIKGGAHVDLYYGTGKQAHKRALDIHHPGKLYLLLPKNDKKMVNP